MSWGGGNNKGASKVAAAFYQGRKLMIGNARTDGVTYWLFDNAIARRTPNYDVSLAVAAKLLGERDIHDVEFSWAGYCTQTTQRHLDALGVPGTWRGTENQREPREPEICGKPVNRRGWYTLRKAAELPAYSQPPKKPRAERFVNLSAPLFA
jgi:hypothetical protein